MLGAPLTPCSSAGRHSGRHRRWVLPRQRLSHRQAAPGMVTSALTGPRQQDVARAARQCAARQGRQRTHAASRTSSCSAGWGRPPL